MDDIIQEIINDERNKTYTKRGIMPLMQISKSAKIVIVGQAPGKKCEKTQIPFDDASGKTLRQWLGIDEDLFYSSYISILPMDFYYPGKASTGDLPPRSFIAEKYHQKLLKIMPHIQLKILLGQYACHYYLGKNFQKNLTTTIAHYDNYLPEYFPLVHPSPLNNRWQVKNPWFKEDVLPQLKKYVQAALNK